MPNYNKKLTALVLMSALAFAGAARAESAGQYVDDAAVTAKIKADFIADGSLHAASVSVNTDHGVVQLTGAVDTPADYALAAEDAGKVSGVRSVTNMLTIRQTATP